MHDSLPDQILGQWLPPATLLRLRLFRLWLCVFFFRIVGGFPQRFEQSQLLFGELLAFAIALRLEKLAQQGAVLVLFRTLVPELLAQVDHDLAQHFGVFGERVGIDRRHGVLSE